MSRGSMKVSGEQIRIGRVLHEDDDFMTIEIPKRMDRPVQIEDGDRFLTLMFVRSRPAHGDPQRVEAWLPWEGR